MEKKETKTLGTREKNLIRIISDLRGGLLHVLKNEEEKYGNEELKDIIDDISNLKNQTNILSRIKNIDFETRQSNPKINDLLEIIENQSKLNLPDNIKYQLQKLKNELYNGDIDIDAGYVEYFKINQKITETLATLRDTDKRVQKGEHFKDFKEGVGTVLESDLVIASRNMANSIQQLIKKINQTEKNNPQIEELSNEVKVLSQGKAQFFGGLDLLSRVTELVVKMKFDEQEKYKEYFSDLQKRLEDISSIINTSQDSQTELSNNEQNLSNDFEKNMAHFKERAEEAESVDDLKTVVFSNIESIEERLKDFKEKQGSLREKANREVNKLQLKVSQLTDAQEELRKTIEEKDKQMMIDDLTSIYNKLAYEKEIESLHSWWLKNKDENLHLAVLDIDHFKSINDKLGHDIGDVVLREVALSLRRIIGPKGMVYRWGGEEFVIIIPELNLKSSIEILKNARLHFENNPIKIINHAPVPITISGGIASFHKENDTPNSIFKKADSALYFSKNNGRNKISFYKIKK
jgi:diguanylate cyclase (GGDEF)-like protein